LVLLGPGDRDAIQTGEETGLIVEDNASVRSNGDRSLKIDLPAIERAQCDNAAGILPQKSESDFDRLAHSQADRLHDAMMTFAVFRLANAVIDHHLKRFLTLRSKPAERSRLRGNVTNAEAAQD